MAQLPGSGTALLHGLSIYTDGGSAVSAYGPFIGRDVGVVAITIPNTEANRSFDTVFAVTGAAVGDAVIIGPPSSISTGVSAFGFVSSAGNVTLRLSASQGTVNQTAQTWSVDLIRRSFITSIR